MPMSPSGERRPCVIPGYRERPGEIGGRASLAYTPMSSLIDARTRIAAEFASITLWRHLIQRIAARTLEWRIDTIHCRIP